jgi:hypothetical protein
MFQQCDIRCWFLKIKGWPLFGKKNVIFKLWIFYYYVNLAVFQHHQYEVPISHLILWYINCVFCHDVHDRVLLLTSKLLNQWFLVFNVDSSLRKVYGRHHDHVCRNLISVHASFKTYYWSCDKNNTSVAFGSVGTVYPSTTTEFTSCVLWGSCCPIVSSVL